MTRTYRRCPYRPCFMGGTALEEFHRHRDDPGAARRWRLECPWKQGRVWLHRDGARCDVQWRKDSADLRVAWRQARRQEERLAVNL